MARIYTRTGDTGETGLIGGGRAPKSDLRVELYGTADELNACLGLVAAALRADDDAEQIFKVAAGRLDAELAGLQSRLFDLGALLADPGRCTGLARGGDPVPGLETEPLEASIDAFEEDLEPLRGFILPGGCPPAAALHVARTVCRRFERLTVAASAEIAVPPDVVRWLNRLSDWLFTASRWIDRAAGVPDRPWLPGAEGSEA